MGWEFESDFRQHPWHRVLADALLGLVSVGNFCLILVIVRMFRARTGPLQINENSGGDT